jgi:hypothetical protein
VVVLDKTKEAWMRDSLEPCTVAGFRIEPSIPVRRLWRENHDRTCQKDVTCNDHETFRTEINLERPSFGMLRRVALVRTDISEENIVTNIRVLHKI